MPPPMQIVTSPQQWSSRSISWMIYTVSLAPVQLSFPDVLLVPMFGFL
jgi:hypothetical protein